jgi:valyl-tRNA synthetase
VTPAHDKADFEIGLRHKLAVLEVINADGTMNDAAGADLKGLDRFKARKVAVEKLNELGLIEKEEPYKNNVGYSERADVLIEPRLSEQWFLKYPSVPGSKACVAEGRMKFHPERWAKVYDHWLTNIQDWCISRQLWWGHRIPVWYRRVSGAEVVHAVQDYDLYFSRWELTVVRLDDGQRFSGDDLYERGKEISGNEFELIAVDEFDDSEIAILEAEDQLRFKRDPDVLDTWFSSWLWPFATMGWPEQTETLKKFYPTTDLVTGPDIIFFWVARMIMAGYEFMGELPFQNVYFTGIIRDKQGRKMSKTLGNSPDPLELIAQYGADALRFGTMRSAPLGQDVLFDEKDVELGRNFCNKLWNACRFRQMVGQSAAGVSPADQTSLAGQNFRQDAGSTFEVQGEIVPQLLTSDDKWILLKLDQAIREVTQALADYKFSEATAALYRFFWSEYCDWYVEASKAVLSGSRRGNEADQASSSPNPPPHVGGYEDPLKANTVAVIDFVLGHTLRMFHPFLPFITEELWHGMGFDRDLPANQGGKTIMFAAWPKPLSDEEKTFFGLDDEADKVATAKYELVSLGRNLRRELKLDPAKKLKFVLKPVGALPATEVEVLKLLLNAESVEVVANYEPPKGTPSASNSLGELFLPTTGLIDFAAERARRTKELETIRAEIGKVQTKLASPAFTEKAPAKVLEEHRQRLADWRAKEKQILAALENLPE